MEYDGATENELRQIRRELEAINRHLADLNSKTATAAEKIAVHEVEIRQNRVDINDLKLIAIQMQQSMAARAETMKTFERVIKTVDEIKEWTLEHEGEQKGRVHTSHLIGALVLGVFLSIGSFFGTIEVVKRLLSGH